MYIYIHVYTYVNYIHVYIYMCVCVYVCESASLCISKHELCKSFESFCHNLSQEIFFFLKLNCAKNTFLNYVSSSVSSNSIVFRSSVQRRFSQVNTTKLHG